MEKVIFITNEIFIKKNDLQKGGVRLCTDDYVCLLSCKYDIIFFPVKFDNSFFRKIKSKLGIDVFVDYNPSSYESYLFKIITENNINKVFINLSNAISFSTIIKNRFKDDVKVILCSHGIEGGDFLHNTGRSSGAFFSKLLSSYKLGEIFKKDLEYRMKSIDMVLTVSEVEMAIENWLGAKDVFFVPRVFSPRFLDWNPKYGRLGFVADVSHFPNFFGLERFCQAIHNNQISEEIELIVVGKPCANLKSLENKYSFIKATGYLDEDRLEQEASTWMYFLNLVFYYSKGVSTKLQLGLNWGLPVLSTPQGNRGYVFKLGGVIECQDEYEMVNIITSRMSDKDSLLKDKNMTELAALNSFKYSEIMDELFLKLNTLY